MIYLYLPRTKPVSKTWWSERLGSTITGHGGNSLTIKILIHFQNAEDMSMIET